MGEHITVGRVSGLFGTRGWVRVESWTRPRENLLDYSPWWLACDGSWQAFEPLEYRRHHGGLIARLSGIADRDQAATLVRSRIAIEREQLGSAPPGEYYWVDLIGLEVVNREGQRLGTVEGLLETGAHDVLRIGGERERLVPFVSGVHVLEVDLAGRRIVVDWHEDD